MDNLKFPAGWECQDQKENLWGSTTWYNSTACRLKTSMIPARTRMCTNFSCPAKNLSFHNHSWNSFFKIHKLNVMCTIHLNMWNLNTISTFYTSTRLINMSDAQTGGLTHCLLSYYLWKKTMFSNCLFTILKKYFFLV